MNAAHSASVGIKLTNILYQYPHESVLTLDHVSWEIEPGDFVVVTGPSGSGKSTMLRCLNGLVPHFSGGRFGGEANVFGIDTRNHGPRHMSARVGFVFQDPESQAVTRIVEDDIAFGLEQASLPRQEMRKRVEEVLDLLGIAALRRRDITTLSGGERQRVAIAGTMALRPSLLVLDEPTSQLDPWGADEVLTALHRLNDDLGLTIVLAEHRLDRVASSADTMRIVNSGSSVFDGPPAEALQRLPYFDQPPLVQFAGRAEIRPVPLTVKAARRAIGTVADKPETMRQTHSPGVPIVRFEQVQLDRGQNRVLSDFSANIHAGQVTALMGRNGSGKSSLIQAMLGMIPIEHGAITVAGQSVTHGRTRELAGLVGYLPQDPARLLFAETVSEELAASTRYLRNPSTARNASELLDELDIGHLAHRHPRDLSAGERERVALAAVLIASPGVLVLDEPTRGMDGTRKRNLMLLLERERERGTAIIMATHDVELVAQFADRVILIGNGDIIADDCPASVLSGSVTFSPQMNRLFGGSILTVDDALTFLHQHPIAIP